MKTFALCLATLLGLAPAAWAKPDFSKSTITVDPAKITEGDVVFSVVLRNTGDQDSPYTEVHLDLP